MSQVLIGSNEFTAHSVQADLVAVLVAVTGGQPRILTTRSGLALPAGPFTSYLMLFIACFRECVLREL